jgi:putative ribosome biogenesis GTPase RsgA
LAEIKSKSISKVEKAAYTDLLELNKRVEGDHGILKELVGKNILMLLGTTGTGKSTMANAFTLGPENIEQTDDGKYVAKNSDHITNESLGKVFKIGH